MCELAYPLSAVLVNWVVLDATLSLMQVAGGAILLAAITRLSVVNEREVQESSPGTRVPER